MLLLLLLLLLLLFQLLLFLLLLLLSLLVLSTYPTTINLRSPSRLASLTVPAALW